jgi:hypothetical protein
MAQYGKPAYWDERYTRYVKLPVTDLDCRLRLFPPAFVTEMWDFSCVCMWVSRSDPEPFDWYQRYSGLKDLLGQYVKKSDHILMSGCGNSRTSFAAVIAAVACHHLKRKLCEVWLFVWCGFPRSHGGHVRRWLFFDCQYRYLQGRR